MTGIGYVLLRQHVVERIPKYESAQKDTLEKETSPATPAGTRIRDLFDHESDDLTTELSWLPVFSLTALHALISPTKHQLQSTEV